MERGERQSAGHHCKAFAHPGNRSQNLKSACRGIEHGERSAFKFMDVCGRNQLVHENVILDGEMVVWNKTRYVLCE